MKKLLFVLSIAALSNIAGAATFATTVEYTGNNNGAACTVKLDLSREYVSMGDVAILARKKTIKENTIILEGGADFTDARITLTYALDDGRGARLDLQSAKLETRNPIKFFYTTKLKCTDLIRLK